MSLQRLKNAWCGQAFRMASPQLHHATVCLLWLQDVLNYLPIIVDFVMTDPVNKPCAIRGGKVSKTYNLTQGYAA